jgi:hypothetical protein
VNTTNPIALTMSDATSELMSMSIRQAQLQMMQTFVIGGRCLS